MGTTTIKIHYRKKQKISEAINILGHVQGMAKKGAGDDREPSGASPELFGHEETF